MHYTNPGQVKPCPYRMPLLLKYGPVKPGKHSSGPGFLFVKTILFPIQWIIYNVVYNTLIAMHIADHMIGKLPLPDKFGQT